MGNNSLFVTVERGSTAVRVVQWHEVKPGGVVVLDPREDGSSTGQKHVLQGGLVVGQEVRTRKTAPVVVENQFQGVVVAISKTMPVGLRQMRAGNEKLAAMFRPGVTIGELVEFNERVLMGEIKF